MNLEQRIAKTSALMLRDCERRGVALTADLRVGEDEAAVLLGYSAGSLRNLRTTFGSGPAHYRRPAPGGGRVSYRIEDLAEWVEKAREEDIWTTQD
jgi:hypothetical protein